MTKHLTKSSNLETRSILISIHPHYVAQILSGEKTLEFRRSWAKQPVNRLIIYTTAPISKIVAIADVSEVTAGTAAELWKLCKIHGGGIGKDDLMKYLSGKESGVAVKMSSVSEFKNAIDPTRIFGIEFKPPQSYRYLDEKVLSKINRYKKINRWG